MGDVAKEYFVGMRESPFGALTKVSSIYLFQNTIILGYSFYYRATLMKGTSKLVSTIYKTGEKIRTWVRRSFRVIKHF